MEIRLPVKDGTESFTVRTVPLFAYEADLHGTDIIIEYPFLKAFGLQVDTACDCLKMSASTKSPKLAGPLDVDRQDMAVPLDVGCQDLASPLDVGCPDGPRVSEHNMMKKSRLKGPKLAGPLDVDRQDVAVPLDVGCQDLAIPLDVGCPDLPTVAKNPDDS